MIGCMDRTRIIPGRLVGPTHVELDESVNTSATIEVVVRESAGDAGTRKSLLDVVRSLPAGNRTREDIDRQIADERDSWNGR